MFIAALFIIARTWKHPRCPSADEWMRKLWYIYTMEYYSDFKKNTFESVLWGGWNWSLLYRVKWARKKNTNTVWKRSLSHVWLFATPWTVARQAPPSMGFSRQEYWSGLLFPIPGDLPGPGITPGSPSLQADSVPTKLQRMPLCLMTILKLCSSVNTFFCIKWILFCTLL